MRIEFNAGFLNQFSISVFKEHSFRFEESVDTVKDGFDNVVKFIYHMNGGVGILQDAVDLVKNRAQSDAKKVENIHEARRKCADFLEEVKQTDKQVARKVRTNTKEFCKKYPHLVPKSTSEESEKSWLEKGLDWLKEKFKKAFQWGKKKVTEFFDWAKRKGKEVFDKIVSTTTEVVNWLIDTGKNIYEGLTEFFEFCVDNFIDFIDKNVQFWGRLIENAGKIFISFVDWAGEKLANIGQKIGEICSAIGNFFSEHWQDVLNIAVGALETIGGLVTTISAIGEIIATIATGGTLTPVAVLQLMGGVIATKKGIERIIGGFWGAADYEPTQAEKLILTPFKFIEDGLNDLVPGWHLGDILGFCGDLVGIAGGVGEIIIQGPQIVKVIGVALDSISAISGLVTSFTNNKNDDAISSVVSGGSAGYTIWDTLSDIAKAK